MKKLSSTLKYNLNLFFLMGFICLVAFKSDAQVTHSTSTVPAGNVAQNTDNYTIYDLAVSAFFVSPTSLTFTTTGTYTGSDIKENGFKVKLISDFGSNTIIGSFSGSSTGNGETITITFTTPPTLFPGISHLLIQADISATATIGNTIKIDGATNPVLVTYSAGEMGLPGPGGGGTPTITNNQSDLAGLQTISAYTPPVPVANYTFCGNANDTSPNANNGTINGATPTTDRFGNPNSAYSFDGVDDYISTANLAVNETDNWTMSAWVKPNSLNQFGSILLNGYDDGGSGNGYSMIQSDGGSGTGNTLAGLNGGVAFYSSDGTLASTANWYQVVMTRIGGLTKFYINGVQTANTSSNGVGAFNGASTFRIGSQNGNRFFNGAIDDVKVYNSALTDSEVLLKFNEENTPETLTCVSPSATLVANYTFCNNANDATANTNNGTVNGATLTTDRFGNANSAFSFDGNDFIEVADNPALQFGTNNYSVGFWFKSNSTVAVQGMVMKAQGIANYLNHPAIGKITSRTSNPTDVTSLSGGYNDGNWHYVTFTRNGVLEKLYVDGTLSNSATQSSIVDVTSTASLNFGRNNQHGSEHFIGELDDVKIYSGVLTDSEILSEFQATSPSCTPPATLVANYTFCGNANDISGNDHNGSSNGVTLANDRFENANSAFSFDGVDDAIDLGGWFTYQNFSVSMWLKPSISQVTYANIIDNNHSGSAQNWVCQQDGNTTNTYGFGMMNNGFNFNLDADQWQHLVLVKSATTMEVYINGAFVQSIPYTGGTINYSGQNLQLGRWGGGGRHWNGVMDDVKMYDGALTLAQVQAEYAASSACSGITATITNITNVACFGGNTGSVTITPSGGTGPYTISPAQTGLIAGNHIFTITDNLGASNTVSVDITEPPLFYVTEHGAYHNDILCFGQTNGSYQTIGVGGTIPYIGEEYVNNLAAGTYAVSLTDANGCIATKNIIITSPASALEAIVTPSSNLCGQPSASIVVSGGNPSPNGGYYYLITVDNGGTITYDNLSGNATLTGPSGDYIITIKDGPFFEGCVITKNVTLVGDGVSPGITCPANITVNVAPNSCGMVVNYTAPVGTDNCPMATTTLLSGLASGSTFPAGVTTNVYKVTDAAGNTATCSFTITVIDNIAPTFTNCPAPITETADANCTKVVSWPALEATDNCTPNSNTISGFNYLGTLNGHKYFGSVEGATWEMANANAQALGGHLVTINSTEELNFVNSHGFGNLIGPYAFGIWLGISDKAVDGNFQWVTGEPITTTNWAGGIPNNSVGVIDYIGINVNNHWESNPSAVDKRYFVEFSSPTISQTEGLASGSAFPIGTTTNTFEVTDAAGNTATCSFTVTINPSVTASISYNGNSFCKNEPNQLAVITGAQGGTFSTTTGAIFADNNGTIDLAQSPIGPHHIVYTIAPTGPCPAIVATFDFEIKAVPFIDCPQDIEVCKNSPVFTLPNIPAGATVTVAGLANTNGLFDPANQVGGDADEHGNFTYDIVYYLQAPGGCTNICTYQILVKRLPNAFSSVIPEVNGVINGQTVSVCKNSTQTVNMLFSGGTGSMAPFTFTYTLNGLPQPDYVVGAAVGGLPISTATTGSFVYHLTKVKINTGCEMAFDVTATVNILEIPTVTLSGGATYCAGENSATNLTVTFTGGGTISGTLNNNSSFSGSSPITVVVSPASTSNYLIQTVNGTSCPSINSGMATVTIKDPVTGTISGGASYCEGSQGATNVRYDMTGQGPWSGTLSNGSTFSSATTPFFGSFASSTSTTLTITSVLGNGCPGTASGSVVYTVKPKPVITCPANFSICLNASPINLAGLALPTGGNYRGAVFQTNILNNVFNPTTSGLGQHQILYDYRDPNTNCDNTCSFTITVTAPPAIPTVTPSQPNCNVGTGSILVNTMASEYSFDDGVSFQASNNKDELVPGTYKIKVKDANGCISEAAIAVIEPQPTFPAAPTVSIEHPTCNVATAIVTITNPVNGYTYLLNGNAVFVNGSVTVNIGIYTAQARNEAGCLSPGLEVRINDQPPIPLDPEATVTQPTCTVATGSISIDGLSGFTYSFDGGTNFGPNNSSGPLATGDYLVKIKSSAGCESAGVLYTLNAQPASPAIPILSSTPSNCISSTGTITVTAPIGNDLTYKIDNGDYQLSASFSNVTTGLHTITVKNILDCIAAATITVGSETELPTIICPANINICKDAPAFDMGALPAGGVYSGSAGIVSGNMFDPALASTGTHNITYTYTATNGCSASCTFQIGVSPLFTVESQLTSATTVCQDAPAGFQFIASGLVQGAQNFTVSYNIDGGPTQTATAAGGIAPVNVNTSIPGTYTFNFLSVQNPGDCPNTLTGSYTFTINPKATATLSGSGEYCVGSNGSATLSVAVTGTGPWAGSLTGGTPFSGTSSPISVTVNPIGTITYSIAGFISGGCTSPSGNGTAVVTVNPLPVVTCPANITVCESDASFTLSGALPTGGIYTGVGVSAGMFNPATAGAGSHLITYSFTDGNGCSNSCSFNIIVNSALVTTISYPTESTCNSGASIPVTIVGALGGGFSALPAGLSIHASTGLIDPSTSLPGTYVIDYAVAASGSCPAIEATFQITLSQTPTFGSFTAGTVCQGEVVPITFTGLVPNSVNTITMQVNEVLLPNLGYADRIVTVTADANGNASTTLDVSAYQTVTYKLRMSEVKISLCVLNPSSNDIATFTIKPRGGGQTVSITENSICSGGGTLNGVLNAVQNYGINTNFTYEIWNLNTNAKVLDGSGVAIPLALSTLQFVVPSVNLPAGTYRFKIVAQDIDGCGTSDTGSQIFDDFTVSPTNSLSASANITHLLCNNSGSTGAINLTVNGGGGIYTFAWSNGAMLEDISGLAEGPYTVTISEPNTCSPPISETYTVIKPTAIVIQTSNPVQACDGQNGSISIAISEGTEPYNAVSSGGSLVNGILTGAAGSYTITITDGNGCTTSQNVNIASCDMLVCTLPQTLYGTDGLTTCLEDGTTATVNQLMSSALSGSNFIFGLPTNNRTFTLMPTDITGGAAANIFKMLPTSSTSSSKFGLGGASFAYTPTWTRIPLASTGKIANILLANTMALYFNLQNSTNLDAVPMANILYSQPQTACGSGIGNGVISNFQMPTGVISYLTNPANGYSPNVTGLFNLANDALGGKTGLPNLSTIASAADKINKTFNGCRLLSTAPAPPIVFGTGLTLTENNVPFNAPAKGGVYVTLIEGNPLTGNILGVTEIGENGLSGFEPVINNSYHVVLGTDPEGSRTANPPTGYRIVSQTIKTNNSTSLTQNEANAGQFGIGVAEIGTSNSSAGSKIAAGSSIEVEFVLAASGPLPVRLISFTGKSTEKGNELNWKTSSEQNFSHYEVERSSDAKTFEMIGKVEGAGNTNEKLSYDFVDKFSGSGMVSGANTFANNNDFYYRLKLVDLDGKSEFSKVIYLGKKENTEIKVYPNPATDFINIENLDSNKLNIRVLDELGREIISQTKSNDTNVKIPIGNISTGTYFIQIQNQKQTIYRKVVVNK
jgi:Concanavalin A-like lectin/glucanases superfamily/HYR domain/Secretion system C-terminal sorting domain/Lectin C-type domain/SprB repeat